MKTLLLIAALCFVGCTPPPTDTAVKSENWTRINTGGHCVHYKIVIIDGNEYIVTSNTYGDSLCPRLPPKVRKVD